jgi:hypothetical protein
MRGIEDTSVLGVGLQSGVGQLGIGYLGVRGEGLDADGLSLDLQFAADKTLTARKGPTPVFTRGSSATQVGATGLIEYAPENLALQSENFGTSWVNNTGSALTLNDALSPTGTLTADRINFPATATTGLIKAIQQSFGSAVAGNGPTTASVWLRAVSGTSTVYLTLLDGGAPWQRVHVACNVTTEWARFSVTLNTPAISLFLVIGPDTRTTNGTPVQPAVQDAASVYAWGAQLERHSSARAYIPTTTAAVYAPRFDHDPLTLACKGLLIEEARTNVFVFSQVFTNVNWNKTRSSITANAATAPDGTLTADKLVEDTTVSSTHTLGSSTVPAVPATLSVFAKKGERNWIVLRAAGSNDFFNLDTGVATTNVNSPRITALGNGWYRCSVVALVGTQSSIQMSADGITTTYTGDGTSGIFVWGAQFEAGSFPTSYIPTTTASVVRSADVCSITGADFTGFYNQSEGSFACNYSIFTGFTGNRYAASIEDTPGGTQNGFAFRNTNNAVSFIAGGGYNSTIGAVTTTISKHISAYSGLTEFVYVKDSVVGTTTGAGTRDPSLPIRMSIGSLEGGFIVCGHISAIRYYRKRLPNAKLQALTA